jgi:hypothetical protein
VATTASTAGAPNNNYSSGRDVARFSGVSMFDPLFLGIDEFGAQVTLDLVYRNILAGENPAAVKAACST